MILKIVKEAIDYYDPSGLLNLGAPDNEYLVEAKLIRDYILVDGVTTLKEFIIETFKYTLAELIDEDRASLIEKRIINNLYDN
jgi:hypothetical protein